MSITLIYNVGNSEFGRNFIKKNETIKFRQKTEDFF